MNDEITRSLRRLIAVSDRSVIALRQVAELAGANDQPMAILLANIADVLDGATYSAIHALAHNPTDCDELQFAAILGQLRVYAPPPVRLPDDLAPNTTQ